MADRAPQWSRSRALRAAAVVLAPVAIVAALVPLRDHVRNANLALVLVLVVLAAAVVGGRRVGLIVGVVVAIAFDFFLTKPYQSFSIERADDIQTTVLLAAVGLVGGELVERARRSREDAAARQREVERFQRRAELASWGERPGRLIAGAQQELTDVLGLLDATYKVGPPPRQVAVLTHDGARVPAASAAGDANVVALPVRAHGRDLGHFMLVFPQSTVGMSVSTDCRHAAVALADQLGMALLRYEHG